MTEITLKLTFEELKALDKYVELNDETRPLFDKIRNAYPKPETLYDVIRNLGYSVDMCDEIVDAVEEFEKSKEKEMIKRNLKTSLQELANGDVRPIDDVVRETKNQQESWMDKPVEELVAILEKNPPDCLKFVMGQSLEQIIADGGVIHLLSLMKVEYGKNVLKT
jgi:predicted SPOUT superfamily RNA methylase MTH1